MTLPDAAPILLERTPDRAIATLTFNRPHARNALTLDAMRAFAEAVETLHTWAGDGLRAAILTGAGTAAFCAGGDLVDLADKPTEADALAFITVMGDALAQLERLPVPVIAALNGYALGGGSEIALACDLRIVDETAQMGLVQMRLALTPGWGAGQRLLRAVGYARALDILLQARPMPAPELLALGLAAQIAPAGEALAAAQAYAQQVASHPPEAVRAAKALLWAGVTQPYADALRFERELFPPLWAAEPHLSAVERFLRGRKR
jgi:enoyl-CoA hydratase